MLTINRILKIVQQLWWANDTLDVKPARQYRLNTVVLLSCAGQPGQSDPVFQRKSTVWLVSILDINKYSFGWFFKSLIPANKTTGLDSTLKCWSAAMIIIFEKCKINYKVQMFSFFIKVKKSIRSCEVAEWFITAAVSTIKFLAPASFQHAIANDPWLAINHKSMMGSYSVLHDLFDTQKSFVKGCF